MALRFETARDENYSLWMEFAGDVRELWVDCCPFVRSGRLVFAGGAANGPSYTRRKPAGGKCGTKPQGGFGGGAQAV